LEPTFSLIHNTPDLFFTFQLIVSTVSFAATVIIILYFASLVMDGEEVVVKCATVEATGIASYTTKAILLKLVSTDKAITEGT